MGAVRKRGWRSVKRLYCYRIEEVADLLGVHIRTVRNWTRRDGLEVMRAERPYLIRGDVLIVFLQSRKKSSKRPLRPSQFYCLKCRAARDAAEGMVDCAFKGERKATLTALCEECETVVHRHISRSQIQALSQILDLTITQGSMRLRKCA